MAKYECFPNSSSISLILYNDETQILQVTFSSGRLYDYEGVPKEVYDELIEAKSVGSYFAKNVKGKFDLKKENGNG